MVRLIVKSDGSVGVGSQRNGPHAASMLLRQDIVVGDDAPSDDGAVVAGGVSTVVVSRTVVESAVSSAEGTDADTDL